MNVSENETNNRRNNKKYKVSKNCIVKTRRDIKQAFVCNSLENPFNRSVGGFVTSFQEAKTCKHFQGDKLEAVALA